MKPTMKSENTRLLVAKADVAYILLSIDNLRSKAF